MEVHHPHHPSHNKNWKEYFLEFFMLFIAVTLGFFAENLREGISEKKKVKELIEVVGEDLKGDLVQLENLKNEEKNKIILCDTFREYLDLKPEKINQDKYYHVITRLPLFRVFNSIDKSRNEAEAKGYFLNSENKELSFNISKYNANLLEFKELEKLYVNMTQKYMYDIVPTISNPDLFQEYWKRHNKKILSNKIGILPIKSEAIDKTKFLLTNAYGIVSAQINCIDTLIYYGNKCIFSIKNK